MIGTFVMKELKCDLPYHFENATFHISEVFNKFLLSCYLLKSKTGHKKTHYTKNEIFHQGFLK